MAEANYPKMTHIRLYRDHETNTWGMQYEGANGRPGPLQGTSEAPTTMAASEILAGLQQVIESWGLPAHLALTVYVDPAKPDAPERQP